MGVRGDISTRGALYRTRNGESPVVYNAQVYNAPLLPFEKHLVETIGATEEEYRYLVAEVIKRGRVRPAGYEHIPDIQAGPLVAAGGGLTVLGSLVVGVSLSVISYLLTPKPKQPKIKTRELDSVNKAGRYNPTFGFDSQAEVATYGTPLAIPFGSYDETNKVGGMLISPSLVWSRMFSYGTQQAVKLMFIVGEEGNKDNGILKPDLSGIFLGNNALDAIYQQSFCFYWRGNSGPDGSRIKADHQAYGTRGTKADGDPATGDNEEVCLCPTREGDNDTGFSSVHSLSNNVAFGCYSAIANGSVYRVNWEVVNWIQIDPGEDDPGKVKERTIAKIAGRMGQVREGPSSEWRGMTGKGRNYSRRMGINKHKRGGTVTTTGSELKRYIQNIQIDDICEFIIRPSGEKVPENLYGDKVKVDDINSAIDQGRAAADDALQLGEIFQIGRTLWQVTTRSINLWTDSNNKTQTITLKCIDNNGGIDNDIGIVGEEILNPSRGYISDTLENKNPPGSGWFPLLKRSKAVIKNTRNCDSTELGIRSKVNQSLNGLFNFQSILTPAELGKLWKDGVNVRGGTISASIKRSSLFSLQYRKATEEYASDIDGWKDFDIYFAVIGSNEVDQYNWLRVRHPEQTRYEFQIVPIAGAALYSKPDTFTIYQLKADTSYQSLTARDGFKIEFSGEQLSKKDIKINKEFLSEAVTTEASTTYSKPSEVSRTGYVTGRPTWDDISRMTSCVHDSNYGAYSNGNAATGYGRGGAFTYEVFGNASTSSINEGHTKTVTRSFNTAGGNGTPANEPVALKITAIRNKMDPVPSYLSGTGTTHNWVILGASPEYKDRAHEGIAPTPKENNKENLDWVTDQIFRVQVTPSGGNPFATNAAGGALTVAGIQVKVTGHEHINDVKRGQMFGMTTEIFGDPASSNMNDEKTVSITVKNTGMDSGWKAELDGKALPAGKTLRLNFFSKIISANDEEGRANWTQRTQAWDQPTISVDTTHSDTTGSSAWNKDEEFIFYKDSISNANNPWWRALQGRLGYKIKVTNLSAVYTPASVTAERVFENQSQIADISFYGSSLVKKSNESAPEHVCSFVNEYVSNTEIPKYSNTATACLALKASRNFSSLDQIRVWLSDGVQVKKINDTTVANWNAGNPVIGSSNLFTDLVYYLLTDSRAGVGDLLGRNIEDSEALIDVGDDELTGLRMTGTFLEYNKLFFNGALTSPVNIRNYISEMAPNFLCDFILSDGRFSLKPSVPVDASGEISTNGVVIKQIFTSGNILEDSFTVNYIEADERRDFRAVVRYRAEVKNQLPTEKTVTIRRAEGSGAFIPTETFDLTDFCTSGKHAELVGKYFLSLRKQVTHTCSFQTTPYGLDLGPGDYIRVTTESSPYHYTRSGTIAADGTITLSETIEDGQYTIMYYPTTTDDSDVEEVDINVSNGTALDWSKGASIFSIIETVTSQNVYKVEQLTLGENQVVEISATEFPCDNRLVSLIAREIKDDSNFTFSRS